MSDSSSFIFYCIVIGFVVLAILIILLNNEIEYLKRRLSYDEDRFIELEEKVNNLAK